MRTKHFKSVQQKQKIINIGEQRPMKANKRKRKKGKCWKRESQNKIKKKIMLYYFLKIISFSHL